MKKSHSAFTLVELSIVLVILGLLVGGVLTGQSLIRAAELRAVTTENERYQTAVYAFRDKYFAIPGDMTNATQFWGSLGGTGSDATCQNTVATGMATCNGNGDGRIIGAVVGFDEPSRFWQHLVNAGLIEGSYSGVYGSTPGVNFPRSKIGGGAYWQMWYQAGVGSWVVFAFPAGNAFNFVAGAGIKPEEAWNIDKKVDDGLPGKWKLIALKSATGHCTTTPGTAPPGDANSAYDVSYATKECTELYWHSAI